MPKSKGDGAVKKTNKVKYLCVLCCIILLTALMPSLEFESVYKTDREFFFRSLNDVSRFCAYIPYSLNHSTEHRKMMWIEYDKSTQNTEKNNDIIHFKSENNKNCGTFYILLKSVFENHLSYCPRDVFHLLI